MQVAPGKMPLIELPLDRLPSFGPRPTGGSFRGVVGTHRLGRHSLVQRDFVQHFVQRDLCEPPDPDPLLLRWRCHGAGR